MSIESQGLKAIGKGAMAQVRRLGHQVAVFPKKKLNLFEEQAREAIEQAGKEAWNTARKTATDVYRNHRQPADRAALKAADGKVIAGQMAGMFSGLMGRLGGNKLAEKLAPSASNITRVASSQGLLAKGQQVVARIQEAGHALSVYPKTKLNLQEEGTRKAIQAAGERAKDLLASAEPLLKPEGAQKAIGDIARPIITYTGKLTGAGLQALGTAQKANTWSKIYTRAVKARISGGA